MGGVSTQGGKTPWDQTLLGLTSLETLAEGRCVRVPKAKKKRGDTCLKKKRLYWGRERRGFKTYGRATKWGGRGGEISWGREKSGAGRKKLEKKSGNRV